MRHMALEELLKPLLLKSVEGEIAGEVSGLSCHTEKIEPGALFFSLQGRRGKGWQYAAEAFQKGALAAVVGGDVMVKNVISDHLKPVMAKLREAGVTIVEFA